MKRSPRFVNSSNGFASTLRYQDKLSALYEHALRLSTSNDLEEISRYTLNAMEYALAFDFAYFGLVEKESVSIHTRHSRGIYPRVTQLSLAGPGITVKAAKAKKTINVQDTRLESTYVDQMGFDWKDTPTMLSELAVPVTIDDKVVAILNVESKALNAFNGEDEVLLETLAVLVATHMKRIRNAEALRQIESQYKTLV